MQARESCLSKAADTSFSFWLHPLPLTNRAHVSTNHCPFYNYTASLLHCPIITYHYNFYLFANTFVFLFNLSSHCMFAFYLISFPPLELSRRLFSSTALSFCLKNQLTSFYQNLQLFHIPRSVLLVQSFVAYLLICFALHSFRCRFYYTRRNVNRSSEESLICVFAVHCT